VAAGRTHNLKFRITRGSNTYGSGQFPEKLIPFFVKQAKSNLPLPIYGDGMQTREWLNVDDHSRGIWLAATKGLNREIYNLGTGCHLTNIEIALKILNHLGLPNNLISHVTDRKGHDRRYSIDSSKARALLGFNPKQDFDLVLEEIIRNKN
jgi:dTDP-glucose 4,6-dehydratase